MTFLPLNPKLILFLSCFFAVAADLSLVWWAKRPLHPPLALVFGVTVAMCSLFVWGYSMRRGIESATAITVYALSTVAACSLLGWLVFKEPLSTTNAIGMALAVPALVLLTI
jgi:multidrug transporter EmrE-like cation transporter